MSKRNKNNKKSNPLDFDTSPQRNQLTPSKPCTEDPNVKHLYQLDLDGVSQKLSRKEPDKRRRWLCKAKGRPECWNPGQDKADDHDGCSREDEDRGGAALDKWDLCRAEEVHDESLGEEAFGRLLTR